MARCGRILGDTDACFLGALDRASELVGEHFTLLFDEIFSDLDKLPVGTDEQTAGIPAAVVMGLQHAGPGPGK